MKRLNFLVSINAIIFLLVLLSFNSEIINAQYLNKISDRPIPTKSGTIRTPVKEVRTVFVPQVKVIREQTVVTPTTLIVTVLPGAKVSLESISLGKKINLEQTADVDKDQKVVTFENLRPGNYKLSVSLKGYEPVVGPVPIQRQKISTVPVDLKKITYEFPIQANINEGELRYAPVKILEEKSPSIYKVQETGGYCVVEIKNQQATIKGLTEGYYNIDISDPNSPEYEKKLLLIQIPDSIPQSINDKPDEKIPFKVELKNTQSTGTFISLLQKDWTLPEKWGIKEKGGIITNGTGVALPKENTFRNYKDFEMRSTVRLLNNTSIGFVIRAQDDKNYYLIQLTGSEAKEKYLLTGTIIKNDKPPETPLTVSIKHIPNLPSTFSNHDYFGVIIRTVEKNKFLILYEDIKTGISYELGKADFKDNDYPIGAVGISAVEKSSFEVGIFIICNEKCKEK